MIAQRCTLILDNHALGLVRFHCIALCYERRGTNGPRRRDHQRDLPDLDAPRRSRADHLQPVPRRRRDADADPHRRPLRLRQHPQGGSRGAGPGSPRLRRAPPLRRRRVRRHGPLHGRGPDRRAGGQRHVSRPEPDRVRGRLRRPCARRARRRQDRARRAHAQLHRDAPRPSLGTR
jgi:hypothetical protein